VEGSMDFKTCVRLALKHSPYFTKSALNIDIRRLDESDSRYSFIPDVSLHTRYYFNTTAPGTTISFVTDPYNPAASYFSLKARKLITQVAVMKHLQAISMGIDQIARKLLELDSLAKGSLCQNRIATLAGEKLVYVQERHKTGGVTHLEVQMAEQELALARAEVERIDTERASLLEGMCSFLGLDLAQKPQPDLPEARRQLLGDYHPEQADREQARAHSFALRIQELKKQLQEWNINLAYARYMPNFHFGIRDLDPFAEATEDRDYFFFVGIQLPLWDGLKRARNISRQKIILRQYKSDIEIEEKELALEWQAARRHLKNAAMTLKMVRSSQEMARLKVRRSEIRYNANGQPLSLLLDSRVAHLETRKRVLSKGLDYDLAVLKIRHLSGDLFDSYVNVTPWQEE